MDFWYQSVHFRRGPHTIFRKQMPSGMGTESLGMIGCIFAENEPLESGIESSFWGSGCGAKGDFIPNAYSWRNDLWKVNFKRVCKKPAGVPMVI